MRRIFALFLAVFLIGCAQSQPTYSVLFLGDTHFGESYDQPNYDHSLAKFKSILIETDFVIANLETPLTTRENSPLEDVKDILHWSDPTKAMNTFARHNMNTFSLANNHAMDYGEPGMKDTFYTGMEFFGAGGDIEYAQKPFIYKDLVVVGVFEHRDKYEEDYDFYVGEGKAGVAKISINQIKDLRRQYPDKMLIVFPHWGDNYKLRDDVQEQTAHGLIDAGADLIIGHGAHMMQEVEEYKGKLIVYSIGNFVFNSKGRYESKNADPYSAIARLEGKELRLYPTYTNNLENSFQGRFVTEEEFQDTLKLIKVDYEIGEDEYGKYIILHI